MYFNNFSPSLLCTGPPDSRRAHLWQFIVQVLIALLAGLVLVPANAENAGRFEVVAADYRLEDGMWLADARVDLELSDQALEALRNSVALTIQFQFEVNLSRPFWADKLIESRRMNIELRYLSLSQRYIIRSLGSGEQESYATLYSALRRIGKISNFAIVTADKINPEDTYNVSLRAVLNRETLPGPLQMLAFWRGDYSLESKWYRWKLKQ
jgi:hypothetical protein